MRVPLTILDHLYRAETVFPERTAVVDEPSGPASLGGVSYRSLARLARGVAVGLDNLGLDKHSRVAVCSPNSARLLTAMFGVSAYGRVLVPINFRLNSDEVRYIVEHSGASVLLVDPEIAETLADVRVDERIVLDGEADAALFAETSELPRHVSDDEDAVASINYTSGTTARPKGVQLTHRNLWLNAATFGWHIGINDRDQYLHTLPLFHCNGWGMPYALTAMGAKHVIVRKIDGEEILRRVEAAAITLLCCAPAVAAAILDAATSWAAKGQPIPGRDRVRIVLAGAPPPSRTIERIESELGWEFIQIYGLTETSPLLTVNRRTMEDDDVDPAARATRLSRAGVPAVGVRMNVDEEGQIFARSNHVFDGYWKDQEETDKALRDGWFNTGDGGRFEGPCLVIADRKKDVIITGGENVSSIEVEDTLYRHPAVAEAAVIGVPDEKWGETIKALVVLRAGMDADDGELIAFCRERIAHYKCPTSVDLVDTLPRTATGKLQKFKLREPYWEGRERLVN